MGINMSSMIGEAMMIAWAELGLTVDNIVEEQEQLTIFISVPEDGYRKHSGGEIMAGKFLAKRFKDAMTDLGVKRLTVKSRIRSGDIWTEEKAKDAELKMRKRLYGSQY